MDLRSGSICVIPNALPGSVIEIKLLLQTWMKTLCYSVYIVDDDVSIRNSLHSLLRSVGYSVACFGSTNSFIDFCRPSCPSCLILDIRMPGRDGLHLQKLLCDRGDKIPILFLTGYADISLAVRAMKAGAFDFLLKPFNAQVLLDTVAMAIQQDYEIRSVQENIDQLDHLTRTLTSREKEVLRLVADGLSNKDIASNLSLAEITVKVHRASGVRKLNCKNLADLFKKLSHIKW